MYLSAELLLLLGFSSFEIKILWGMTGWLYFEGFARELMGVARGLFVGVQYGRACRLFERERLLFYDRIYERMSCFYITCRANIHKRSQILRLHNHDLLLSGLNRSYLRFHYYHVRLFIQNMYRYVHTIPISLMNTNILLLPTIKTKRNIFLFNPLLIFKNNLLIQSINSRLIPNIELLRFYDRFTDDGFAFFWHFGLHIAQGEAGGYRMGMLFYMLLAFRFFVFALAKDAIYGGLCDFGFDQEICGFVVEVETGICLWMATNYGQRLGVGSGREEDRLLMNGVVWLLLTILKRVVRLELNRCDSRIDR